MNEHEKVLNLTEKMKELVDSKRDKDGTAVSVAFIKDGELISAFACGTQDGDPEKPVKINDLFNIGSIGKTYCALAVMKLVEMGKVNLDTPVTEYLPRFHMKDERYRKITLCMCLNHSSGLPGTNIKNLFCDKWISEGIYDQLYDYFSKSKLKADPGDFSVYCNDGFMLADMVVSEVSGMSYIQFLQENITHPIGALSTCAGDSNSGNGFLVQEKDKPIEYNMVLGAGGIRTDLSDLVKMGYLLIDPKGIINTNSLNEIISPQGKSFIPGTMADNFGLGLDSVNFISELYNFGENVLLKSGGSESFSSFLLIIRKYNLSAAISSTYDNKIDTLAILCELCCELLKEYGITTRIEQKNVDTKCITKSVSSEFVEKFSGIYYNYFDNFLVNFDDDLLKIQKRGINGWNDMINKAYFDGQYFVSGTTSFFFEEHRGSSYLLCKAPFGKDPMTQKCKCLPPLNNAWKNRINKRYIVCDANPADLGLTHGMTALTIKEFEQEGLVFFVTTGKDRIRPMSVIPSGDWETEMIWNAPGGGGSRDGYAPFIFEKDGIEYLYAYGLTFIDTAYLKPLQTGQIISDKGEHNKVYTITARNVIHISIPTGVRVIILNSDLLMQYDSASGQEINETYDGFILFINDTLMNVPVEVY